MRDESQRCFWRSDASDAVRALTPVIGDLGINVYAAEW
jgi:hypothetical protein